MERAIAAIPKEFGRHIDNLTFLVEDWADAETLAEVGFDDPRDLLGYYQGVPLPERSVEFGSTLPDTITIYRGAVENHVQETGQTLSRVLRETVIHELAHYFGFSEDQMDRIEELWRDRQGA